MNRRPDTAGLQPTHLLGEICDLAPGERRSWFVEDQHLGIPQQSPHDLDKLLAGNRQLATWRSEVDIEAESLAQPHAPGAIG